MPEIVTHETQSAQPGEFAEYLKAKTAETSPTPTPAPAAETASLVEPHQEPLESSPSPTERTAATWEDPETGERIEKPGRADKRIKRLWTEREQERARANRLEQELAALRAGQGTPAAAPQRAASDASAPDDLTAAARARIRPEPDEAEIGKTYATYEAFVKDCAIWGGELAAEKRAIQSEQSAADAARTETQTRFGKAVQAARAEYDDFDEVTSRDLSITQAIFDAVVNAPPDIAGHVFYYLGAHPEETARIAALPPGPALVAMGEILGTVRASRAAKAKAAEPEPKPRSNAPAPLVPVPRNGGSPTHADQIAESGGSAMDFIRLRNAEVGSRRRL